jgi:copper chaperone
MARFRTLEALTNKDRIMLSFHVPKMACGGCLKTVTLAVQALDPQAQVDADLDKRTIRVATHATEEALLAALRYSGYPAAPALD